MADVISTAANPVMPRMRLIVELLLLLIDTLCLCGARNAQSHRRMGCGLTFTWALLFDKQADSTMPNRIVYVRILFDIRKNEQSPKNRDFEGVVSVQ
ncbi:hypothetical protein [Nocardia brasiliensis]|uniref:hypothetical protein n=1 Tax=Nocardia brasiliensis TaxID=37326 RepID=UPI003D94992E